MTGRENTLRALRRQKPEWIPEFHKEVDVLLNPSYQKERIHTPGGFDWFGVYWREYMPNVDGHDYVLKDITKWRETIKFPDLDAIDWESCAAHDTANLDRENKVFWIANPIGLFERLHALMSFEDALMCFYEEPEELQSLIDALTDFKIDLLGRAIKYYKPDVIQMHDDYGTQLSTFISPELWRKFFKKNIKRISDFVKSHGVVFLLHSCGKVESLIGDFVECGVDGWDSVQKCNDLPAIAKEYGDRICFTPAIGAQPLNGKGDYSEEEARAEIRWFIDNMGQFGGLVPRPVAGMIISPETSAFMQDEVMIYGREYYKRNPIKSE